MKIVESGSLRFVERDGKRILQQAIRWTSCDATTLVAVAGGITWEDVPLVEEKLQ